MTHLPSRRVTSLLAVLTVLAVVGGLLSGCALVDDDAGPTAEGSETVTPRTEVRGRAKADARPVPASLVGVLSQVLAERADAVLNRDRDGFGAGLDRDSTGFVTAQEGYFDNLAQLPISTFAYELDRTSLVRQGRSYWVVVELAFELDGYDAEPARSLDRFRFSRASTGPGYVLSSVTDPAWEEVNDITDQPWDQVPIQVRTGDGVLGIFDEASVASARPLLTSVERGLTEVRSVVPYEWSGTVVVYGLSDTRFIAGLDDLPGGDPRTIDGVAFSVPVGVGSTRTAATRFALSPALLDRPGPARDRLVRHELTHVAVGTQDDRAPVWLSEGIAEHVSVQPLAPEARTISRAAIEAASAGDVALAADDAFNDDRSEINYGIAWWACEYVAATFGESALWALLDSLNQRGADPVERTRGLVGLTPDQLARRGARLMLTTYGRGGGAAG